MQNTTNTVTASKICFAQKIIGDSTQANQYQASDPPIIGAATEKCQGAQQLTQLTYSMKQAAALLGISYVTAQRLVSRGHLKSLTALRTKRIPATEIQRFLATLN